MLGTRRSLHCSGRQPHKGESLLLSSRCFAWLRLFFVLSVSIVCSCSLQLSLYLFLSLHSCLPPFCFQLVSQVSQLLAFSSSESLSLRYLPVFYHVQQHEHSIYRSSCIFLKRMCCSSCVSYSCRLLRSSLRTSDICNYYIVLVGMPLTLQLCRRLPFVWNYVSAL